jgi:hypothetical protein
VVRTEGERVQSVILERLHVETAQFERGTGWAIKPEGACRDERCVPLPPTATAAGQDGQVDVRVIAQHLGMPLVHEASSGLWALGPQASTRSLTSARAPDLVLPDMYGQLFDLATLRGTKVLLLAWASW